MWKDPRLWWTARSGSRGDLIVKDQLQRYAPRLHGSTPGSPTVRQLRCCGTVFQTGPAEEKREVETERESEKEREGKKRMGGRKRRMWQLLDADRVCAAGYTAFGEASALAPVPLRLRDQAQFGRERRSFIYQAGRTAAEAHTHSLSHSRSHTHGRYCTHTLIHRAGRQHDFILQSGFSARYDGGEPPARSRGQNVSYSALLLVRQWRVGACVCVCCPEKQLSDVEMLLCYLMCDQNRGQNEGWSPCDCICVLLC